MPRVYRNLSFCIQSLDRVEECVSGAGEGPRDVHNQKTLEHKHEKSQTDNVNIGMHAKGRPLNTETRGHIKATAEWFSKHSTRFIHL